MTVADALLPEFDREMVLTRQLLERVPDERLAWKPHAKSRSFGELATHVASLPLWGARAMNSSEFDMDGSAAATPATSTIELLERFDASVAQSRAALVGRLDAELMTPWTLKQGGRTMFTMPRTAVWRTFLMNHLVHHRGQLSVYLRLNDLPVPAMYGPSADETPTA